MWIAAALALAPVVPSGCAASWPASRPAASCATLTLRGRRSTILRLGGRAVDQDSFDQALLALPASAADYRRAGELAQDTTWVGFSGVLLTALTSFTSYAVASHFSPTAAQVAVPVTFAVFRGAFWATTYGVGESSESHLERALDAYNAQAAATGRCPVE